MQRHVVYIHSQSLIEHADRNPAVKGRATLTHNLISSYDLLNDILVIPSKVCKTSDLCSFHSRDYIAYITNLKMNHSEDSEESAEEDCSVSIVDILESEQYGLGYDCPIWKGINNYLGEVAGATITACEYICSKSLDTNLGTTVVINWTGGWHHGQRDRAAGYCYVNDIVLGINVLHTRFKRVLYVDLDTHHGDAVQAAFIMTQHVLTLSFHQFEDGFYPGTGAVEEHGAGDGKGYTVNCPYRSGLTGLRFRQFFKRIASNVLSRYQPDVCVVQCGADAIVGDPLGATAIEPADLIQCVGLLLKANLPTVLLGGGGYNFPNASRYWTQLMAMTCGKTLTEDIPDTCESFLAFGPGYSVIVDPPCFIKDYNTDAELDEIATIVEDNLTKYNVSAI